MGTAGLRCRRRDRKDGVASAQPLRRPRPAPIPRAPSPLAAPPHKPRPFPLVSPPRAAGSSLRPAPRPRAPRPLAEPPPTSLPFPLAAPGACREPGPAHAPCGLGGRGGRLDLMKVTPGQGDAIDGGYVRGRPGVAESDARCSSCPGPGIGPSDPWGRPGDSRVPTATPSLSPLTFEDRRRPRTRLIRGVVFPVG